jgi:hypothetical protein
MITKQSKKIFTYILFGAIIFAIIKIIPNNTLSDVDTFLISAITIVLCASMEKHMNQDKCVNNNYRVSSKTTKTKTKTKTKKYSNSNSNSNKKIEENMEEFSIFKDTKDVKKDTKNTKDVKKDTKNTKDTKDTKNTKDVKKDTKDVKKDTKDTKSVKKDTKDTKSVKKQVKDIKKSSNLIKQISLTPDKINFPFSSDYLKTAMNDILKAKDDEQLATKVRANSKSNKYYEILVQLVQTNIEAVYRNLKKDFNKINEIILDVKLKRENDKANPIKIDGKTLSVSGSRELSNTVSSYLKKLTGQGRYIDSNGFIQNMVDNDMKYTIYSPTQHEKLGTYDSTFNNEWKNDYALLNTEKWRPPISSGMYKCKTEKKCPVCPSITTGYPVNVKDFDIARKILPPDLINVDYINEKLITGLA